VLERDVLRGILNPIVMATPREILGARDGRPEPPGERQPPSPGCRRGGASDEHSGSTVRPCHLTTRSRSATNSESELEKPGLINRRDSPPVGMSLSFRAFGLSSLRCR
jgi:hypothetical protein